MNIVQYSIFFRAEESSVPNTDVYNEVEFMQSAPS
jgi:hypothetical protein